MEQRTHADFEEFWKDFLRDHWSPATRWMHVAALASGVAGVAWAVREKKLQPLLFGVGVAAGFAVGGHPLFQGDRPKNFRRPAWAARAFVRLCVRTVTGAAAEELKQS